MSEQPSAPFPVSPLQIVPPRARVRNLPINELGAADFGAILSSTVAAEGQGEALAGILRDVAEGRIVHPVIVRDDPAYPRERYHLVSGWLVWSAAVYLRMDSIAAVRWEGSDLEALALAYRLNHHRVQMSRGESAKIASLVAEVLGGDAAEVTYRDVARVLKCSPSWAHKLLNHHAPAGELQDTATERRGRGRPPVQVVFSVDVLDPRRWESSMRLRAVLQGKPPRQEIRFQQSEECDGWHDVPRDEFFSAIQGEVERLRGWLDFLDGAEDDGFSRGKTAMLRLVTDAGERAPDAAIPARRAAAAN